MYPGYMYATTSQDDAARLPLAHKLHGQAADHRAAVRRLHRRQHLPILALSASSPLASELLASKNASESSGHRAAYDHLAERLALFDRVPDLLCGFPKAICASSFFQTRKRDASKW